MSANPTYRNYFNIDPKYYAVVTSDLIKSGKVKWNAFFPHESFIKLLESVNKVLSGHDNRCIWVEGAYGSGKSHAVLALKSLLDADDQEVRDYFADYGLQNDLCEKLIADKHHNGQSVLTVFRSGSSSIRSDQDLILAIQSSVDEALQENGLENKAEGSLCAAALKWLESPNCRQFFDSLIKEPRYSWYFANQSVSDVIKILKEGDSTQVSAMMKNVLKVAKDNGISALSLDIKQLCNWLKEVVYANDLKSLVFIWDEFTEFFLNNQNSLTGFQELTQLSANDPIYFMIVTHKSSDLLNASGNKKLLNRFVGDSAISIELPDNMAFRLMHQAMKETSDETFKAEWEEVRNALNDELIDVRSRIVSTFEKKKVKGSVTDDNLCSIVPIHPFAALLLKYMSVAFSSNARSMFDFIINNEKEEGRGFKWYINAFGPDDESQRLLAVDMLWDFFVAKQGSLADDVRLTLNKFNQIHVNKLLPEQERVFKAVILLEALSSRIANVTLLRPTGENIDLAFSGIDWPKGKALNIVNGLVEAGRLFEKRIKSAGETLIEYTAAQTIGTDGQERQKLIANLRESTKTPELVTTGELVTQFDLSEDLRSRFIMVGTGLAANKTLKGIGGAIARNHYKVLAVYSRNDEEYQQTHTQILNIIGQGHKNLVIIECLTRMGDDLFEQYLENGADHALFLKSDRSQAEGYEKQAKSCLTEWKTSSCQGGFYVYTPDEPSGVYVATADDVVVTLKNFVLREYPNGLEHYSVNDTLFTRSNLAQGAACGISQTLKGTFFTTTTDPTNPKKKIEVLALALSGAWNVENYWKDPAKKNLPIVLIKDKIDKLVKRGFNTEAGRVSILSLFEALEDAPFGFMPNNFSAFILGFVLKEYATSDYFWSNDSISHAMTPEDLAKSIADAIKRKAEPSGKFKEAYIVKMSPKQRAFLDCTATSFNIDKGSCGSIESARTMLRIKMQELTFPIWCVKGVFDKVGLQTPVEEIEKVVDYYCNVANTANGGNASESVLAENIGDIAMNNPNLANDLAKLFTKELCREGMLAYLNTYQEGALVQLAQELNDGGSYLERVKSKFNADAANWVWNVDTANEKIDDVILEYRIVQESNKSLTHCSNLDSVVVEWNNRTNNIRVAFRALAPYVGDLNPFLEQLYFLKQNVRLLENNKKTFLDLLLTQREAFDEFYNAQLSYFKQVAAPFIANLTDEDVYSLFTTAIPVGQFTKEKSDYFTFIDNTIKDWIENAALTQLKSLWEEKTATKDPIQWSDKYETPILAMFDDAERADASEVFKTILAYSPSKEDVENAIAYLQQGTFYDKLADASERDRAFMERIVGDYSPLLPNLDVVRKGLETLGYKIYEWMDNSAVQSRIRQLADKEYKLHGADEVKALIDKMDANELRQYLCNMISENLTVGIEILKKQQGSAK